MYTHCSNPQPPTPPPPPASQDLNVENSSLGDILEETEWDINSDVTIATDGRCGTSGKRSLQAEKEIRYIHINDSGLSPYCPMRAPLQNILFWTS